jgi:hypothetical protein
MATSYVASDTRADPIAAMRFIAVIAVLVVLAAVTGNIEFRWWTSAGASNVPAANDVKRVANAASAVPIQASFDNLAHRVNGVNIKTADGVSVLVYELPGLAARIAEQSDEARLRVGAVQVDTATGRRFRAVVARALLAQRLMYEDLAAGVSKRRTAQPSFVRWVRHFNRLKRWMNEQVTLVLAEAPFEDQAPVQAVLNNL